MSESLLSAILDDAASSPTPPPMVPVDDVADLLGVAAPVTDDTLEATREDWLERSVECMRPWFAAVDAPLPARIRVSVGIPASASGRGRMSATGQTWAAAAAVDGLHQVFISPLIDDVHGGDGVLSTLIHELVHCAVGLKCGHKADFKAVAILLGLEGPMPSSVPSTALANTFVAMAEALGPYPHRKLDIGRARIISQGLGWSFLFNPAVVAAAASGGAIAATSTVTTLTKPQRNRWMAVQCPGCGAKVRASRSTLERVTLYCDCGNTDGAPLAMGVA